MYLQSVTENQEDRSHGLVFEFGTTITDDDIDAAWQAVEQWIVTNEPGNRMKHGILNGRRAFVTLRFSR
jgi:hypothetical protein